MLRMASDGLQQSLRPCGFSVRMIFQCDLCGIEVSSQEAILEHMNSHEVDANNDARKGKGEVIQVTSESNLAKEKVARGRKTRSKSEKVNGQVCRRATDPVVKLTKSTSANSLTCPTCGQTFVYAANFRRHIKSCTLDLETLSLPIKQNDLHVAGDRFSPEQKVPEDMKGFAESTPDRCAVNNSNDVDNVTTHVQKSDGTYQCHECNNCFSSVQEWSAHIHTIHSRFACVQCYQIFSRKAALNSHMLLHKIRSRACSAPKPYVCSQCPLSFTATDELLAHIKVHEEILLPCASCSGSFKTKETLEEHVQHEHSQVAIEHACDVCGSLFDTVLHMEEHVALQHPKRCASCGIQLDGQTGIVTIGALSLCTGCSKDQLNIRERDFDGSTKVSQLSALREAVHCDEAGGVTCGTCGRHFTWKSNLRRHMRTHLSTKPPPAENGGRIYECPQCGRMFNWRSNMLKHLRLHTEQGSSGAVRRVKQYSCPNCGQLFAWPQNLGRHLRQSHPDANSSCNAETETSSPDAAPEQDAQENVEIDIKPHMCDVCSQQFNSLKDLACHRQKIHSITDPYTAEILAEVKSEKDRCACKKCGEHFFWESNLRHHMKIKHGTISNAQSSVVASDSAMDANGTGMVDEDITGTTRNQICGICGRRFSLLYHLRMHLHAHTNAKRAEKTLRYLCSECGRGFGDARQLRVHMFRHSGVRPHQCSACGKSFTVVAQLNEHVATKHEGRRYMCELCGHEANSRSALHTHVRGSHPTPGTIRPYACTICSRRFWSPAALKRHESSHADSGTAKRKAMCSLCGLLFRHVYNLKHHVETTHADTVHPTPFACATCSEQFESGTAFKTHYRSRHRNR